MSVFGGSGKGPRPDAQSGMCLKRDRGGEKTGAFTEPSSPTTLYARCLPTFTPYNHLILRMTAVALKYTCEMLKPEVLLIPKPDHILGSHQGVGSLPVNTVMVIVSQGHGHSPSAIVAIGTTGP